MLFGAMYKDTRTRPIVVLGPIAAVVFIILAVTGVINAKAVTTPATVTIASTAPGHGCRISKSGPSLGTAYCADVAVRGFRVLGTSTGKVNVVWQVDCDVFHYRFGGGSYGPRDFAVTYPSEVTDLMSRSLGCALRVRAEPVSGRTKITAISLITVG